MQSPSSDSVGLESVVAESSALALQYRPLQPSDHDQVKEIHELVFPIRYPDAFYRDATSGAAGLYTVAAVDERQVVGVVVGSIVKVSQCDQEDTGLLELTNPREDGTEQCMMYILTLGVLPSHKRRGIGSHLVNELVKRAIEARSRMCHLVYLHVLTTNMDAVHFYEKLGFTKAKFHKDYYAIAGAHRNAFSFVKYINDGRPPATFTQTMAAFWCHAVRLCHECVKAISGKS